MKASTGRTALRAVGLVALLAVLAVFLLPSAVLAHAEISPERVEPGDTQTFTMNVVTEKRVPTTGIRVRVPEGFRVTDVRSPGGGWEGRLEDGSIVWAGGQIGVGAGEITSPTGERIVIGDAEDFVFTARVPEERGTYALDTAQTYDDGSVVEWAGAEGSKTPAPFVGVGVAAGAAGDHGHGEGNAAPSGGGDPEGAAAERASSLTPTYIMTGLGVLAAVAVVGTLALLRRRPVTEPAGPSAVARPAAGAPKPATPYKSPRTSRRRRNR